MKVSSAVLQESYGKKTQKLAILPLVPEPVEENGKTQMITHQLLTNPNDNASPKYKITVVILQGNEDARQIIDWRKNTQKILKGLAITDHKQAIAIVETLVAETPRALFEEGVERGKANNLARRIEAAGTDDEKRDIRNDGLDVDANLNMEQIELGLQTVVRNLLPRRILARVKRYLRRECRKPAGMKVRTYYQHLLRINMDEIPRLPPFAVDQELGMDEMLDILLFGTPKSWQREMDRQGYDPMDNPITLTLDFMERQEANEEFDADKATKTSSKKEGKSKDGKSNAKPNGKQKYYCMLHGNNNSHDTKDCHQLQKEAKRLKSDGSNNGKPNGNGKFKNKTWTRKAEEAKATTQNDLASFIKKEVKKGIKKDLKALSKKRKSDDSSDSEDGELHMFDLKDFNYEDMENLKIDDDEVTDELSV